MLRTFIAALLSFLPYRIARYLLEMLMPPTHNPPHTISCIYSGGTMDGSLANVRMQIWPMSGYLDFLRIFSIASPCNRMKGAKTVCFSLHCCYFCIRT